MYNKGKNSLVQTPIANIKEINQKSKPPYPRCSNNQLSKKSKFKRRLNGNISGKSKLNQNKNHSNKESNLRYNDSELKLNYSKDSCHENNQKKNNFSNYLLPTNKLESNNDDKSVFQKTQVLKKVENNYQGDDLFLKRSSRDFLPEINFNRNENKFIKNKNQNSDNYQVQDHGQDKRIMYNNDPMNIIPEGNSKKIKSSYIISAKEEADKNDFYTNKNMYNLIEKPIRKSITGSCRAMNISTLEKNIEKGGSIFNRDEKLILDSIKSQEKETLRVELQKQIEENKKRKLEEKIGFQGVQLKSTSNNDSDINPLFTNYMICGNIEKSPKNSDAVQNIQIVKSSKIEQNQINLEIDKNVNLRNEFDTKKNFNNHEKLNENIGTKKEEINNDQNIIDLSNKSLNNKLIENAEKIKGEKIKELTTFINKITSENNELQEKIKKIPQKSNSISKNKIPKPIPNSFEKRIREKYNKDIKDQEIISKIENKLQEAMERKRKMINEKSIKTVNFRTGKNGNSTQIIEINNKEINLNNINKKMDINKERKSSEKINFNIHQYNKEGSKLESLNFNTNKTSHPLTSQGNHLKKFKGSQHTSNKESENSLDEYCESYFIYPDKNGLYFASEFERGKNNSDPQTKEEINKLNYDIHCTRNCLPENITKTIDNNGKSPYSRKFSENINKSHLLKNQLEKSQNLHELLWKDSEISDNVNIIENKRNSFVKNKFPGNFF